MKIGTRVRYIGPPKSGVPEGRMGTLLDLIEDGIAMVSWDPYQGVDCQVTHSGAAESDLEVVTSLPRCALPTRPGMYLMAKSKSETSLVFVTNEKGRLNVSCSGISCYLSAIDKDIQWWGPIEVR